MHRQRIVLGPLLARCFLFASLSLLAACGSQGIGNAQPHVGSRPPRALQTPGIASSQSDSWVPPISLRDPSPGQLNVEIVVTMGGYDPKARETTTVALSFQANGQNVQFTGHERLECNGSALPIRSQFAGFQLAHASTSTLEGRTFRCTYSAGGASTTLIWNVPYAPTILSPQDLALIPRNSNTRITYRVRNGNLLGIVALGLGTKAIAHLDTPNQATIDTGAFPTGTGSISLTQSLDPQATQTGQPFKSVYAGGTAMAQVTVTWI